MKSLGTDGRFSRGLWRGLLLATLLIALMGTVSGADTANYHFNESSGSLIDYFNSNDGSPRADINYGLTGYSDPDWVEGTDGLAYGFPETTDGVVDIPNFQTWDNYTISFWSLHRTPNDGDIDAEVYITGNNDIRFRDQGDGNFRMYQNDGSDFKHIETGISADTWIMWTGKWNGTHIILYKNASRVGSTPVSGMRATDKGNFLGQRSGGNELFDGRISELKIYGNEVLTDQQIQNLYDLNTKNNPNNAPQFDSVSTSPSSWTLGSDVNVSANVSDSDGTVDSVVADVWEDGSKIVNDASLTDSDGDGSWEVDNLFTVDQSDVYYNISLTATDDDGATSTYEDSQFIQDLPPEVTIQSPGNSTFWSYSVPYEVDVNNDNDNVLGQDFSCDFSSNGTVFRSVSSSGVDSFSGNFSQDLGENIEFKASCSDDGGTSNETEYFTLEDFQVESVYSDSPVYETENISYESEIYQGEMIESVDFNLIWDGEQVNNASQSLSGQGTLIQDLEHTIPLVSSNNTQKNWKWNFTVERTGINGNTTSVTYSSGDQSQDVFWSYWISGSTALFDQDPSSSQVKVLEGQDAGHQVNVSRETSSADLSGLMNFTRTSQELDMDREELSSDLVQFQASELSDKISSSSRTDDVNSSITVSFQDESREIEASDDVETHQIQFGESAGTDALQFEVLDENNFDDTLESDLDLAVEFWAENSSERVTRTFSTASENKTTHTFQISPSWAELVVDSSEKLIQYQDSAEDYRLRSYFLLEEKISSNVTEIDLYALDKSRSSRIGIETVDSDGSTIPGVIVRAERYFPAQDRAISVAMARTGSDGRTESFFEVNEIYYGFKFYRKDDSGSYELVSEEPQQIISQDLLRFTVSDIEQIGYYDFKEGIGSSCEYNATQVRCSYTSQEAVDLVTLSVEEERPVAWETVCERQASTASGTLICSDLNASDKDFQFTLSATSADGDQITLDTGKSGEGAGGFGETGLMISFFFFLTLGLGSLTGPRPIPEISVLLSTVAIVVSYTSGLLAITYQAAATFVILGAITIYKMRRDAGGGIGL